MDIRTQQGWVHYKKTYETIKKIKADKEIAPLQRELATVRRGLEGTFPGRRVLVDQLLFILSDELSNKERMLNQPRGRPPRPDWQKSLQKYLSRLSADEDVLSGLEEVDVRDPWIDKTLTAELSWYIDAVEQRLELARKDAASQKGDDVNAALREQAESRLSSARALVARRKGGAAIR